MKKKDFELELSKTVNELNDMEKNSKLQFDTMNFLCGQADKLAKKINDVSYEKREEVAKQSETLSKRLEKEILTMKEMMKKVLQNEEKLNSLQQLWESGKIENE